MCSKSTTACFNTDFDNNNGCLRKKKPTSKTCTFWKNKNITCSHCGSKKPDDAVGTRQDEVKILRYKFPDKIPIVLKKIARDKKLPDIRKNKFLVHQDTTMSQFQAMIRNRLKLDSTEALYLLVDSKVMVSNSMVLAEVYEMHKNCDGFLYVTYAPQETFGGDAES